MKILKRRKLSRVSGNCVIALVAVSLCLQTHLSALAASHSHSDNCYAVGSKHNHSSSCGSVYKENASGRVAIDCDCNVCDGSWTVSTDNYSSGTCSLCGGGHQGGDYKIVCSKCGYELQRHVGSFQNACNGTWDNKPDVPDTKCARVTRVCGATLIDNGTDSFSQHMNYKSRCASCGSSYTYKVHSISGWTYYSQYDPGKSCPNDKVECTQCTNGNKYVVCSKTGGAYYNGNTIVNPTCSSVVKALKPKT